jgi:hypothetical protein
MAKDKDDKDSEYKVIDVSTQTEPMIQTPDGEVISILVALVTILNELREIKKVVA